jgi:hypothetical protein
MLFGKLESHEQDGENLSRVRPSGGLSTESSDPAMAFRA